ncbi:MAG: ammonia-forming cytochrome c nitrite reductase subunit c552 [Candidatus Krumholzibacteriia bacterium]
MTSTSLLKIAALLVLASAVAMVGCEGDQGPAGPAGPPGDDGTISQFTFVGNNGQACSHCHVNTVETVMNTAHTDAYEALDAESQENPYCLQCHTVGWDRPVAFGSDAWMTATNPDVNGYDDYFGVAGDEAAARRMELAGVQCENCHGAMGPDFNDHRPIVNFQDIASHDPENITEADITSTCYPCHSTQFEGPAGDFTGGYATSGHANATGGNLEDFVAEFGRSSCAGCHTSEGFIAANDPAMATYDFGGEYNFIGCVTCHDPHAGLEDGGNIHQLRSLADQSVIYIAPAFDVDDPPTMTGKGTGQLCAQCHHARRDNANVAGQIANGSGHMGPHGSPQMDTYIGAGCYEIPGYDYGNVDARGGTHYTSSLLADGCVDCHMVRETVLHGETSEFAFHNFRVEVSERCTPCHGESDETLVTDYQATIIAKLDALAQRFGFADLAAFEDETTGWDSTAEGVEPWQRESAYAIYWVVNDGSYGVHNPNYIEAVLDNAIDYYDAND